MDLVIFHTNPTAARNTNKTNSQMLINGSKDSLFLINETQIAPSLSPTLFEPTRLKPESTSNSFCQGNHEHEISQRNHLIILDRGSMSGNSRVEVSIEIRVAIGIVQLIGFHTVVQV